jgi:multiple sugar transport system substrate-binding protein
MHNALARPTRVRVSVPCAAVFLCMALLSGCAALSTPTPEPVTISFLHFSDNTRHYEELLPVFNEQYPHITVELESTQYEGSFQRLEKSEADVFELYPAYLLPAHEQGALLALTSFVDQDEDFDLADFYPNAVDLVTLDGQMRGIPSSVECGVMVYNKDLFDQYSVPYPQEGWTWDDFLTTAMAIRDPGAGIYGFAPQILDPMYFEYAPYLIDPLYFVYQHGGQIFDDWRTPTRATFDDPLTVEAVEWYVKLIQEYNVAPTQEQARRDYYVGDSRGWFGFSMGKAAMMIAGPSDRFPRPGGGKAIRLGVVALPRGQRSATICISSVHAISAKTEHLQASWQWIVFLSRQMPPSSMPARRSLARSDAYEDAVGEEAAAAARAAIESTVVLPFYVHRERLQEIERFYAAVLDAAEGKAAPQQALSEAQGASKLK